jgi:hypothetical protein
MFIKGLNVMQVALESIVIPSRCKEISKSAFGSFGRRSDRVFDSHRECVSTVCCLG